MTILVGVKCCDGIVIGTDSAVTSAPVPGMSAMTETGASKIEFPFANEPLIVATTGSVGMSLRLHYELRANFTEGKAIKNSLRNNPIKFPTDLATIVTENFRKTFSPVMSNPQIGFQLGALVGFVCKDEPHLVEFDSVQFQPDLRTCAKTNSDFVEAGECSSTEAAPGVCAGAAGAFAHRRS